MPSVEQCRVSNVEHRVSNIETRKPKTEEQIHSYTYITVTKVYIHPFYSTASCIPTNPTRWFKAKTRENSTSSRNKMSLGPTKTWIYYAFDQVVIMLRLKKLYALREARRKTTPTDPGADKHGQAQGGTLERSMNVQTALQRYSKGTPAVLQRYSNISQERTDDLTCFGTATVLLLP